MSSGDAGASHPIAVGGNQVSLRVCFDGARASRGFVPGGAPLVGSQATLVSPQAAAAALALERLRSPWSGSVTARTARPEPWRAVPPWWSILGRVHGELAALELPIVEQPDGLDRVRLAGKLDEGEATRLARFSIGRKVYLDDVAGLGQELRQRFCGGPSAQVPHEDAGWNGSPPSVAPGSAPVAASRPWDRPRAE
jgi:hypothetical protein